MHIIKEAALLVIIVGLHLISFCDLGQNIPVLYAFISSSTNRQDWTQFSSGAQSCPTLCDPMNHSTPGFPVHHQLPEFTQTHVHRVGDAIQPSHSLPSPSPPAPNPSQQQGFSNESVLHVRWPKYWSFSFSNRPSNEYSG